MKVQHKMAIANRVRALRLHYKLNIINFSLACGLSHGTTRRIEIHGTISNDSLEKIISVFGTTKSWIIGGRGEMLPMGKSELEIDIVKRYVNMH